MLYYRVFVCLSYITNFVYGIILASCIIMSMSAKGRGVENYNRFNRNRGMAPGLGLGLGEDYPPFQLGKPRFDQVSCTLL